MAAASYFWSNTTNAFLFNQGPMTPTLIDISMITGLDVTSSANPTSLNTKNQYDFKTKSVGGWSGYVAAYMGQGSVTPREHVAFLLMWLEKFLFCGSSCGLSRPEFLSKIPNAYMCDKPSSRNQPRHTMIILIIEYKYLTKEYS